MRFSSRSLQNAELHIRCHASSLLIVIDKQHGAVAKRQNSEYRVSVVSVLLKAGQKHDGVYIVKKNEYAFTHIGRSVSAQLVTYRAQCIAPCSMSGHSNFRP